MKINVHMMEIEWKFTVKLSNLMRTKSKSNRTESNRNKPNRIETKSIESKRTESNRIEKFPYA
jgi:hypothetical protein